MSKINEIQNKIKGLNEGAFQKLADAYLHKKGYERVNSLGSVIGSDKIRKGTPDTLVPLPNGKYVFAEHTTQQKDLYKKLNSDLNKCFDEKKTRIPVQKIEEVVFCHNSTLGATDENALGEKCQKHRVNLNIFGISAMSYDLYQKFPGIARDLLGVEVDTGQIVPPDEFVAKNSKNKLATRLDTTFHFREEEVNRVLQGLEDSDVVTISGRPGVGKSRLALECCRRFKELHQEFKVQCIYNRGLDLFEDLRVNFLEPGSFLILVDDANRVTRFDYIIHLLQDQRKEDQRIKVIATVRNYAVEKIRNEAKMYGGLVEVEIQPLGEKEIKQLVEDEYGIKNHFFLDRISEIAKGNPRLAIMAAEVTKRDGTLQSIRDVTQLYDDYFVSVRKDLEELGRSAELLKVACIVTFFRVIDRTNEEMMSAIHRAFGILPEAIWKAVHELHDIEVLDLYEDDVARISDQVLSTYLFYLAVFKERVIEFGIFLKYFFPCHRSRVVESINQILSVFDSKAITEAMRPQISRVWAEMEEKGEKENLLHLMDVFWFFKQTETLLYIQGQIEKMEPEPLDIDSIEFKGNSNIPQASLLSVLGSFKHAEDNTFRIALNLLLDYIVKHPGQLQEVFYLLTDSFGFGHTSYLIGFGVQRAVIDVLWDRVQGGDGDLFGKLFIAIADPYLHTRFHDTEHKGGRQFTLIKFELPGTPELFELRKAIWNRLFTLYEKKTLEKGVLGVLQQYSKDRYWVSVREIAVEDAAVIVPFVRSKLKPQIYRHCMIVQTYLDLLEYLGIGFPNELREQFKNETYELAEIVLFNFRRGRKLKSAHKEYEEQKQKEIEAYFSTHTLSDYNRFFKGCMEIREGLGTKEGTHTEFQLQTGVTKVLLALAGRDASLYIQVLEHYLKMGAPLKVSPYLLVEKMVHICGIKRAHEIINETDFTTKQGWLLAFYHSIPAEEVGYEHLGQLESLFREAALGELPNSIDFLLKYQRLDKQLVARITEIILERAKVSPGYAHVLTGIFNPYTEINKVMTDLFAANLDLLKRAYFGVEKVDEYIDYDGHTCARILDIDPEFILQYIDKIFENKEWLNRYEDARDYSFLWTRRDYKELMTKVVRHIYERERGPSFGSNLEVFFLTRENEGNKRGIVERQDGFLNDLIEEYCNDPEFMEFIFGLIAEFPPERRCQFVAMFVKGNRNFQDFEKLRLEPSHWGWEGSAVPMFQGRVSYLESLLPFLSTVDLLQHRQYVERTIQEIQMRIEWEKRSDFMKE
jgi:hypothetical protein